MPHKNNNNNEKFEKQFIFPINGVDKITCSPITMHIPIQCENWLIYLSHIDTGCQEKEREKRLGGNLFKHLPQ